MAWNNYSNRKSWSFAIKWFKNASLLIPRIKILTSKEIFLGKQKAMKKPSCNSALMYTVHLPSKGYWFRETQSKRKNKQSINSSICVLIIRLCLEWTQMWTSKDYCSDQQHKIQQLEQLVAEIGTESQYEELFKMHKSFNGTHFHKLFSQIKSH